MNAKNGQYSVLSPETPRRTRNSELKHKYENFLIKNPLKIGNFHLVFMADKGHKGQNLVLAT